MVHALLGTGIISLPLKRTTLGKYVFSLTAIPTRQKRDSRKSYNTALPIPAQT